MSFLEKFKLKISSLGDSKNLNSLSLQELESALQAQEHRRLIRKEETIKAAFLKFHKRKGLSTSNGKKQLREKQDKEKKKGCNNKNGK